MEVEGDIVSPHPSMNKNFKEIGEWNAIAVMNSVIGPLIAPIKGGHRQIGLTMKLGGSQTEMTGVLGGGAHLLLSLVIIARVKDISVGIVKNHQEGVEDRPGGIQGESVSEWVE